MKKDLEEILNLTQEALNGVNSSIPVPEPEVTDYIDDVAYVVKKMVKSINNSKAKTQAGYDRNVIKQLSGLYGMTMEINLVAKAYRKALIKAVGIKFFWETLIAVRVLTMSSSKKERKRKSKQYKKLLKKYVEAVN